MSFSSIPSGPPSPLNLPLPSMPQNKSLSQFQANTNKKGFITLSSIAEGATDGKVQLAGKKIKPPKADKHGNAPEIGAHIEKKGFIIKKKVVRLNLKENESLVQIEVKIKDLAKFLGVSETQVKKLNHQQLNNAIFDKLEVQLSPRGRIISDLKDYGLTLEEFETFEKFYNSHMGKLDKEWTEPTMLKLEETGLPRSVVMVPNGPQKGMYILAKTHGNVKEIGIGSFNRATLALHMDSGQKKVFRNALAEDVPKEEQEANQLLANDREHFVAGIPVFYTGVYRQRDREKNLPKAALDNIRPRLKDNSGEDMVVEKIGFIQDYIKGGELLDLLSDRSQPPLPKWRINKMAIQYAEALGAMHALNLVHNDQKLENTFVTEEKDIKIADFGMTVKVGETVYGGTPAYMAPEFVKKHTVLKENFKADKKADIWQMGCVLAALCKGGGWSNFCEQCYHKDWNITEKELEKKKDTFFPNRKDPTSRDFILDQCLQLDPTKRLTADQVADMLRKLS